MRAKSWTYFLSDFVLVFSLVFLRFLAYCVLSQKQKKRQKQKLVCQKVLDQKQTNGNKFCRTLSWRSLVFLCFLAYCFQRQNRRNDLNRSWCVKKCLAKSKIMETCFVHSFSVWRAPLREFYKVSTPPECSGQHSRSTWLSEARPQLCQRV